MNKYDHTQLKAGDIATYGSTYGFGYSQWTITKSQVEKLTATQIVLANGMRFRRDNGRKVGGDRDRSTMLLDPKGQQVRNALAEEEASNFSYAVTQWEKDRRAVRTLDSWEICLSQLETMVAEAQRRIRELKTEME